MSKKQEIQNRLKVSGVVAVIHAAQPDVLIDVVTALANGGIFY